MQQRGEEFAVELCAVVEDAVWWLRKARAGDLPPIDSAMQRADVERVSAAARDLRAALRTMAPETERDFFAGHLALRIQIDEGVRDLLGLAREHVRELTPNTDHYRRASLRAIRAVFRKHGVRFSASNNRRPSLAVEAAMIVTALNAEAAKKAVAKLGNDKRQKR